MSLREHTEAALGRLRCPSAVQSLHTRLCALLDSPSSAPVAVEIRRGLEALASFCSALFNVCESTGTRFGVAVIVRDGRRAASFRTFLLENIDPKCLIQLNDNDVIGRQCTIQLVSNMRTARGVSGDLLLVDEANRFDASALVDVAVECSVPVLMTLG